MKFTQLIDTPLKRFLWILGITLIVLTPFLAQETTVGPGDTVVINYTVSINGVIADTSLEEIAHRANIYDQDRTYEPLVIIIGGMPGQDAVAPLAVEKALMGMKVGEEKVLQLYPLDAYGYQNPDNIIKMIRQEFEENSGIDPVVGQTYQWGNRRFTVYQITEESVYLDFNHRFAVIPTKQVVSREEFEQSAKAYVGNVVMYQGQPAVVIDVSDTEVALDVNPAVFEFKVEIIQIQKAS